MLLCTEPLLLLNLLIQCNLSSSGENRARYIQLLLHGLYTPLTLPVGSSERAPHGLADGLLVNILEQTVNMIQYIMYTKPAVGNMFLKVIIWF